MPATESATAGTRVREGLAEPWIGLLAFFITFSWKAAAHCTSVLNHLAFGEAHYGSGAVLGLAGFVLVWMGFRREETAATSLGFMGGSLIFLGLVEPSFMMFSALLGIPPLQVDGRTVLTPNLLLMQASAIAYFVILVLLGADKDTRCRMFLWFHRNFRLRPNPPTPGYRRQPARIAALETVMISWFFYLLIITLLDPRVFGRDHPVTVASFWVMLAWGAWLVWARLRPYRAMGPAIRYAIPVAGILWFDVELASQWRWVTEVWIKPREFPVANLLIGAAFVAAGLLANRRGRATGGGAAPG